MKKLVCLMLAAVLSFLMAAPAFAQTGLANPWKETGEEQLIQTLGVRFAVPEGAEGVVYRMLESESLAEMHFSLDGADYVARIQPADEFTDISGLYYEPWALSDDCTVLNREGRLMMTSDGSRFVALCLWYDAAPGLMYSLSAHSACLGRLNIHAAAENMFLPMQGDTEGDAPALTAEPLHQALASCTGYAGTAGASLKNAAAALTVLSFATDWQLAESDPAVLRGVVSGAIDLLEPGTLEELSQNLASIHSLLLAAFTGDPSAAGQFEAAGVQETAELLLQEENALVHWSVLFGLLTDELT